MWCHDTPRGRPQESPSESHQKRLQQSPKCSLNSFSIRSVGQLAHRAQLDVEVDTFTCRTCNCCTNVTRQQMHKEGWCRARSGCSSRGDAARLRVQGGCAVARDAGDAAKCRRGFHSSPCSGGHLSAPMVPHQRGCSHRRHRALRRRHALSRGQPVAMMPAVRAAYDSHAGKPLRPRGRCHEPENDLMWLKHLTWCQWSKPSRQFGKVKKRPQRSARLGYHRTDPADRPGASGPRAAARSAGRHA